MIVDDQLHTMPMKFGQGLQQAIDRGAEVVQGLDNDGIDLVPGNGTKNRSQPWQPVPALRDADHAINLDGDDRPATGGNSILQVNEAVLDPISSVRRPVVNSHTDRHEYTLLHFVVLSNELLVQAYRQLGSATRKITFLRPTL